MCGICGIIPLRGATVTPDEIRWEMLTMLRMNQERGEDATGIFRGGDKPLIVKANIPADKFMSLKDVRDAFNEVTTYLGHTRKATIGSPKNNQNNHPLVYNNWIVTHNGSIKNTINLPLKDAPMVDSFYFTYVFETLGGMGKTGDLSRVLSEIDGTYAIGAYFMPTRTTILFSDEKEQRRIFYNINEKEGYIRYSQVRDEMLKYELKPFRLLKVQNGEYQFEHLNPKAPWDIIDAVSSLEGAAETPQEMLEAVIELLENWDR